MKFIISILAVIGLVAIAFGNAIPPKLEGRIVNGYEAEIGAAPFIVSMRLSPHGEHFCGGSLIRPNVVLTAAHCLMPTTMYVSAGMHNRMDRNAQTIRVKSAVRHRGFTGDAGPDDVGLLFLERSFKLNDKVQTIALPTGLPRGNYGVGTLYGWGLDETDESPYNLQTVDVNLLTPQQCVALLPRGSPVSSSNICSSAMREGIAACSGDSGGPLVKHINGRPVLVGVVSWGTKPCGIYNYPSVYACVASYLPWINRNLQ